MNCRLTRFSGRAVVISPTVLRTTLPRLARCRPKRLISRSTVQRATVTRSCFICYLLADFACAVDPHIGLPDTLDLRLEDVFCLGTCAAQTLAALVGGMPSVA